MLQHGWHYTKWKKWSESEMLVAQLCLTLCDPMDCSLPGSSVYGISQARILEWVSFSFSRGSFRPRDQTQVSCSAGGFFIIRATRKAKPVIKGQIVYDLTHMKSFSSVQFSCSVMSDSVTPWTAARQTSLFFTIYRNLLKLMFIKSVKPSNYLVLCFFLLLLLLSFPESGSFPMSWLFSSDGQSIRVSTSASVLPMNIQGWFPLFWFDLLAVQGTFKSLLQHHSSKA